MEVRVLQPDEWDILKQAPDGWVPDPAWVTVVVALDEEGLGGRLALCLMPHIEAVWLAERMRNSTALHKIERHLEDHARSLGVTKILAFGQSDTETYLDRLGFKKTVYSVWERDLCPSH